MAASALQHRQRRLRGLWGECIAEFWGTFMLMVFGEAVVVTVTLFGVGLSSLLFANYFVSSFAWGLAVCFGIYTAGAISGAHINPAVTLAFALRRDFPWKHVIPYWVSQCLGAFVAAAIVYLNYSNVVMEPASGESWYTRNLVVPGARILLSTKTCSVRSFACAPMAAIV
jgi:glycerol uptake facilitator protein